MAVFGVGFYMPQRILGTDVQYQNNLPKPFFT
jgi:hypothetical protein